jgi:hypothetical protein
MQAISIITGLTPAYVLALSLWFIIKKPRSMKNLSRAMGIAILGFALLSYFGKQIAGEDNNIFWASFGLLCIYCITIVPVIMHFTSAIRQRRKMEIQSFTTTQE